MQLVRQIVFQARLNEAAPAMAFTGGVASYGTLVRMIEAATAAVEALDLPSGSVVTIDVRSPLQHSALILALALIGIPSASVGSIFSVERAGVLGGLLLTDRESVILPGVRTQLVDDRWFAHDPAAAVDYERLNSLPGFKHADDVVRYAYSSGTTGFPKCVALTQGVLEQRTFHALVGTVQNRGGAGLGMVPFSTVGGIQALLAALPLGMLLCFPSSPAEALQMTRLFRVTILALAVVQLRGVLEALGNQTPPAELEMVIISGSKIPLGLLAETRARLCSNVVTEYGSTEMGSMTTATPALLSRMEGSVGYARPWVEIEAVDADRRPVARGVDGIIRTRSPALAFYVNDGGDRVETIDDGWFYPGDVGRILDDGLVVIVGRTSEVINHGGVIVAPEYVEEALRLDPLVRDVAVVGVPVNGIEEIWAAIVSEQPFDLQAMARAAFVHLNEKAPTRILRVDAIPRNDNGKVMRADLRSLLLSRVRQP